METTRVYIDGFNLYYGLLQSQQLHWLDLNEFSVRLNRGEPVQRIIYCTARVSGTPSDSAKPDRQDAYLRAVKIACPNVDIVFGNFSTQKKSYPLVKCRNDPTCAIRVVVRTEKGSDVNLATHLLHDAHMNRFDRAIVVSGDSDLVGTIDIVAKTLGKTVWVRNPRDRDSAELQAIATDYGRIRPAVALASQLPQTVTDGTKRYSKPVEWSQARTASTKRIINHWNCTQADCAKLFEPFRYE